MFEERAAILIDNYYLKKEVLDHTENGFKLDYRHFVICYAKNTIPLCLELTYMIASSNLTNSC